MSRFLKNEIVDIGYVEKKPYNQSEDEDLRLWIIGAVLGPIAALVILFWIIAFIYYKCINPKRKLDTKTASRLRDDSSDTSQAESAPPRRTSKVKPEIVDEIKSSSRKVQNRQNDRSILGNFSSTQAPSTQSEDSPPPKPRKPLSKKKSIINTLNERPIQTNDIQESIRQKAELERWSNLLYLKLNQFVLSK